MRVSLFRFLSATTLFLLSTTLLVYRKFIPGGYSPHVQVTLHVNVWARELCRIKRSPLLST